MQRLYYGSEHGKGEADGETGIISQQVMRHITANPDFHIRDANDYYNFCLQHLNREISNTPEKQSLRDFILVGREDIDHNRQETDVATVPGTRKIHQAERVDDYVIR